MFKKELNLVTSFLNTKDMVPDFKDLNVILEFPYSNGRTDVVLVNSMTTVLYNRLQAGLCTPLLRISHLRIIYHLFQEKCLTQKEIMNRVSGTQISLSLKFLEREGYIFRKGTDNYFLSNDFQLHINKSIAVECKLKNWKSAIKQALRSNSFANERYILIDQKFANSAIKHEELFSKFNIGLLIMKIDSIPEIVYKPYSSEPYSWLHYVHLNEVHLESIRGSLNACS